MNEADANEASGGGNSVADLQDKITSIRKRKEILEGHRQKLDETGEAQLSLTDPDSRSVHSGTRVGVGYNVQLAVDSKHNLIAEQQVHSKVSDLGLLAETATAARPNCIAPGFLDSGVTVFASTRPRPARRGRVVPERGFGSCTSLASTARCTSA